MNEQLAVGGVCRLESRRESLRMVDEILLPPPRRCERRNRSPNAHFAVTGEALVGAKGVARRARRGVE